MSKPRKLYLIDGTAYIHRAYHAIRNLSNSEGLPTNAIFGFTRMLLKLMEDRRPEYAAMFFDAKGPTFRHQIYDDYKANRPPMPDDMRVQLPYIKQITAGFNLPVFEMAGYEADDLIGTLARLAEAAGFDVVMVTGDKDFKQLVTQRAVIWDPMKEVTIDYEAIKQTEGVAPEQLIDAMGLAGDSVDNIPGVPGIGMKTALKLILEFGGLDQIYAQVDTITRKKQKENLITYKDQAYLSRKLVTIDTRAPIQFEPDAVKVAAPNADELARLFKELEFRQLQQQFPAQTAKRVKDYQAVMDRSALDALVATLQAAGRIALDTETTSQNPLLAKLVGLSFAVKPDQAFYIPVAHNYLGVPAQLKLKDVLAALAPILENPAVEKVGQNIKYDWIVLKRHGVVLQGVTEDTMLASYLINPNKRAHSLDRIAQDYLDHKTITYAEVAGKGRQQLNFAQVPLETAVPYACEDADITLAARNVLMPDLRQKQLQRLFNDVEMPLVPALMAMEMQGIQVDKKRLYALSVAFADQMAQLEEDIYALADERFNVKSSQQLGRILFEKLKLPVQKKTRKKTGYSTDVDVLTALSTQHELPALVLRHRTLAKLKSTYADALMDLINPETGRIHTSFNQTVAATGRLSSSDPNLQNIPIRTAEGRQIRQAFIPREGWQLLSADYSQIELRLLAHCSNDERLLDAFRTDADIHARTAAEVFQAGPDMIDAELRRQAKIINFGIIYGMGPFSLAKELGISTQMARTYIDHYFARYQGVKAFIDHTIETARQDRQIKTLLGRIRQLPDINSRNFNVRSFAERIAVNTPIQGSAADLMKIAIIRVHDALHAANMQTAMLLTVHDELVFEVPPEELDALAALVRTTMESVWELNVPLKVNVQWGENWDEAH